MQELVFGLGGPSTQYKEKPIPPNQSAPSVQGTKPPMGHITFSKPQKFDECRICKVLQKQGGTNLFENHISDYATGCPNFAKLGNKQRLVVAREAKFCMKCMGKEVKFSYQHNKECPILTKKSSYSCKSDKCLFHMWVCTKHAEDNREHMEKFSEQLKSKAGIKLVFTSVNIQQDTVVKVPPAPHLASPLSYCSKDEKGIKRAVRNLHRFNKKADPDVETISPPEGAPIFMFLGAEGLHNPVYTFFDSGCSEAIFREGIPGKELRGTLLTKGPFRMGGVGDTAVTAEEEWLVQFNRSDKKKQLVKGVTMKQITCDFPIIDTTKAEIEVKAASPTDKLLQNCKLPPRVGGRVDVLLGIQYTSIHPVVVRQLDCGLTIYKSRLAAHDKEVDSLIGGPHSSFQF